MQRHREEYARAAPQHERRVVALGLNPAHRLQRVVVQPLNLHPTQVEPAPNERVGLGGGDVAGEVGEQRRDGRDGELPEGVGGGWQRREELHARRRAGAGVGAGAGFGAGVGAGEHYEAHQHGVAHASRLGQPERELARVA